MPLPRSVLLIISGSIASYKSLELIRLLKSRGVQVTTILTKGGARFITPLAVSSLTGTKTYDDLFSLTDEVEMGHIELSRIADVVLVAPASADILAKMNAGLADDLATTALLATNKPVIVAPAMNHKMWSHAATQRNVAQLKADGIAVIEPTEGDMACGEFGIGRMAEPPMIMDYLERFSSGTRRPVAVSLAQPLVGKHAIVTSGPTMEAIDPVRFIANRSSGKQGHAIAAALAAAGARVTLITGPVSLPTPSGVSVAHVSTAEEMLTAASKALPADIFIGAAAVADWKPVKSAVQKLKKKTNTLTLTLVPSVDVLASIGKSKKRPALVIGFAAETENLVANARTKLKSKQADWIIANDVSGGKIFGDEQNKITILTRHAEENWKRLSKQEVAARLAKKISDHFTHVTIVKGNTA